MMRRPDDSTQTPEQRAAAAAAWRKQQEEEKNRGIMPPVSLPVGETGITGTVGGGKGGSIPGTTPTTTSNVTPDMLSRFGYQGRMPVNPLELMGLGQITRNVGLDRPMQTAMQAGGIYGDVAGGGTSGLPISTMDPAQRALTNIVGGGALDASRTGIGTTIPAESFLREILEGSFAPGGQKFREDVYESTKAGALRNLEEQQGKTAKSFAHRGGYFGGEHSAQQAELEARTMNPLNALLGELNLEGYSQDMGNRLGAAKALSDMGLGRYGMVSGDIGNIMGAASGLTGVAGQQTSALGQDVGQKLQAASGLTGLAGTERGIESSQLGDILGGGQVLTQNELQNRQLYQGASDRAYQDWVRARGERMMPMNLISSLLGAQTNQPIVQQPGQTSGGILGNILGFGAGSILGPMGDVIGSSLGNKVTGGK